MTDRTPVNPDEILRLANAVCRDELTDVEASRLDDLLKTDLQNAYLYLAYLDIHAHLSVLGETEDVEQIEDDFFTHTRSTLRWRTFRNLATAVLTLSLIVSVSLYAWNAYKPPIVGIVRGLSDLISFENSQPLALGTILRRGDQINLSSGLLSLENERGVMLDLKGPCRVSLSQINAVRLDSGSLRAVVPPEGIGFTVLTPTGEIVDHGTEFITTVDEANETHVTVRRGEVEAFALDRHGNKVKSASLFAGSGLTLGQAVLEFRPVIPDVFSWFDRVKGGIRKVGGNTRLSETPMIDLSTGAYLTRDHVLIMPERQQVVLEQPITVRTPSGPVSFAAGDRISSFLVHYDPADWSSKPPKGSVTFYQKVAACVTETASLALLDPLVGLPETRYSADQNRGLEIGRDEDQVTLLQDATTVQFHFHIDNNSPFEEFRILIRE